MRTTARGWRWCGAHAQLDTCRRQFLLQYLGRYDAPASCGMCDRCVRPDGAASLARMRDVPASAPFRVGDTVEHQKWGPGTVQHVAAEVVTVHFAAAGYHTLDVRTVLERNLLRRSGSD